MRTLHYLLVAAWMTVFMYMPAAQAQKKDKYSFTYRMNLRLFGGVAFQNGASYTDMFKTERMGSFGSLFLGYRFDEQSKSANYFGVFGSMYSIKPESMQTMNTDQAIQLSNPTPTTSTTGYNLEAGFIFNDWFRLSAGYGRMGLPSGNTPDALSHFTGTGAIIIGRGGFNIHLSSTAMFGGDLDKACFRTNAGIGLNFKFMKGRKTSSNE